MSSVATSGTRLPATPTGFGATLASEWTKLTTVRSTYITAAVGILLSVGIVALISWVDGNWSDIAVQDRDPTDTIYTTIGGSIFATIAFTVIGVNLVASEYSSGMIRMTFTATPQRGRVVAAKMVIVVVFTLILYIISVAGMYLAAHLIYGAYDVPTVSITESDMYRTLLGLALLGPIYPLMGASFAFLLRSTAGAITSIVALMFLPSIFGALLPRAWQENLLAYLPPNAIDAVALEHLEPDSPMYAEAAIALPVAIMWAFIFVGAAWFVVKRRDA